MALKVLKAMETEEGLPKVLEILYNAMQNRSRTSNIFKFGSFGQKDQEMDRFKESNPVFEFTNEQIRAAMSAAGFSMNKKLTGPEMSVVMARLQKN